MARIRTVKPDFFTSEDVAAINDPWTRLAYIGLWTHADDYGRLLDNPRLIKAALFPLEDHVTVDAVNTMLDTLVELGRLVSYTHDGRSYLAVANWHHQRIDKKTESKLPDPSTSTIRPGRATFPETSRTTPEPLPEDSRLERKGKEGNREGKPCAETTTPVPLAVAVQAFRGAARPEDMWEALAHELGEARTETEKNNRGRTRKELEQAGATPPQVHERCAEYRRRYPDAELTDAALRKHWTALAQAKVHSHPHLTPASQAVVRAAQRRGIAQ